MAQRQLTIQTNELKRSSVIDAEYQNSARPSMSLSMPSATSIILPPSSPLTSDALGHSPRTPPRLRAEPLPLQAPRASLPGPVDPKPVKMKHMDAKRRYQKLYTKTVTLPPPMPSPFFTFHVPQPGVATMPMSATARPVRRPRASAPAPLFTDSYTSLHPLYTTKHPPTKTQAGIFLSFKPQSHDPVDLPSSDTLEPVNLQLPEDAGMEMELDDQSSDQASDDPFLY